METGKTKNHILETAKKLFERFGFDKTSMNDIARHSHKAKGSLYYNFEGKTDIFKTLLVQELDNIKSGLQAACHLQESGETNDPRIATYLSKRMELFNNASMVKLSLAIPQNEIPHELIALTEEVRHDFDQWEWQYFHDTCVLGKELRLLESDIEPTAFADMLQMLLKSLEVQFFGKNKYEASKSTYQSMVNFLLSDYNKQS